MVYVNTDDDSKDFVFDKVTQKMTSSSLGDFHLGIMQKVCSIFRSMSL